MEDQSKNESGAGLSAKAQAMQEEVMAAIERTRTGPGYGVTPHQIWLNITSLGIMPRPATQEGLVEILRDLHHAGRIEIIAGDWLSPITKIIVRATSAKPDAPSSGAARS